MAAGAKVRFFPSGMTEVSGDDPDEVALIGAAIAKGIYNKSPSESGKIDQPNARNGADTEPQLPLAASPDVPTAKTEKNYGPFYDASVSLRHPAILALENHILSATAGKEFELGWMRTFVGHEITGVWRECITRSVGTLMARLVKSGVVYSVKRDTWKKVIRMKQNA